MKDVIFYGNWNNNPTDWKELNVKVGLTHNMHTNKYYDINQPS